MRSDELLHEFGRTTAQYFERAAALDSEHQLAVLCAPRSHAHFQRAKHLQFELDRLATSWTQVRAQVQAELAAALMFEAGLGENAAIEAAHARLPQWKDRAAWGAKRAREVREHPIPFPAARTGRAARGIGVALTIGLGVALAAAMSRPNNPKGTTP